MEPQQMQNPPLGAPRYVGVTYRQNKWVVAAESPHRAPVEHALAGMASSVCSREAELLTEVWGPAPDDPSAWHRYDQHRYLRSSAQNSRPSNPRAGTSSAREERDHDRRHQLLAAALGRAGIVSTPAEVDAVAEQLGGQEARNVATWIDRAHGLAARESAHGVSSAQA